MCASVFVIRQSPEAAENFSEPGVRLLSTFHVCHSENCFAEENLSCFA